MTKKISKIPEYIGAIIVNIVLIWVFNNLLNWHIWFLKTDFSSVVWIFTLSFMASIIANIVFLVYDSNWFKALLKLVSGAISFWAIYVLYKIYPFDFGLNNFNNLGKYFLIFCLIATAIGVTVEFFTLIFAAKKK